MSFLQENESISDELIDQMLLTLKEKEDTQEKPPVINTFRLEMKRERRRSRIQLEIVTIAAFVSVTSTVVFTSVFFRFMLPELMARSDRRTKEMIQSFGTTLDSVFKQFGGFFMAIALMFLLGFVFSAVLLIRKRNELFTQNKLKE